MAVAEFGYRPGLGLECWPGKLETQSSPASHSISHPGSVHQKQKYQIFATKTQKHKYSYFREI